MKKRADSGAGLKAMYILREQVYSICSAQNTFIIYIFTRMRTRVFVILCTLYICDSNYLKSKNLQSISRNNCISLVVVAV